MELGKLEALCAELREVPACALAGAQAGRFRRNLAGALDHLSAAKLTVERAPAAPDRARNHGNPSAKPGSPSPG